MVRLNKCWKQICITDEKVRRTSKLGEVGNGERSSDGERQSRCNAVTSAACQSNQYIMSDVVCGQRLVKHVYRVSTNKRPPPQV